MQSAEVRLNKNRYISDMYCCRTFSAQSGTAENYIRGEECQGWMFTAGADDKAPWKAHFLGYYDVKGQKDDKVLNQLANEAMFGMLRWESEAMHPLSV